jgi:hypothetical protein
MDPNGSQWFIPVVYIYINVFLVVPMNFSDQTIFEPVVPCFIESMGSLLRWNWNMFIDGKAGNQWDPTQMCVC